MKASSKYAPKSPPSTFPQGLQSRGLGAVHIAENQAGGIVPASKIHPHSPTYTYSLSPSQGLRGTHAEPWGPPGRGEQHSFAEPGAWELQPEGPQRPEASLPRGVTSMPPCSPAAKLSRAGDPALWLYTPQIHPRLRRSFPEVSSAANVLWERKRQNKVNKWSVVEGRGSAR